MIELLNHDNPSAVLLAYLGSMEIGGWPNSSETEFLDAIWLDLVENGITEAADFINKADTMARIVIAEANDQS